MAGLRGKIGREIRTLVLTALYFGSWISVLLVIKHLLLAEYQIQSYGWSAAVVGALVLSKVVLVLDHVPLGPRVRAAPAWVDVVVRTALYAGGVVVVLGLEHGLRGAREHGGFFEALRADGENVNVNHFWVNVITITSALLVFNAMAIIRRRLGESSLALIFLRPLAEPMDLPSANA